ncbi:MAG: ABC transporter permease, partial [Thermomicrobiales bacterium]|nr:ABC transporter permease [Thermomicrobiales bacterium]
MVRASAESSVPGSGSLTGAVPGIEQPADPGVLAELGQEAEQWNRPHSNLWIDAWRRLSRNKLALFGLVIVILFVFLAIFAPVLAPYGESEVVDVRLARMTPNWTFPMGLDRNARDIFSRLMYGARVSMVVGLSSYFVILLIAIPIGSIAGYYGGKIDTVLMRLVDVVYTIPQVLLVMLFVNARGPGLLNIILGIGLIGWVTEARLIRAQFL